MSRDHLLGVTLLTALTPILWGTTYIVSTELLPDGRPLLVAAVRALPVGAVFVLSTRRLPEGVWWWRSAVLGTLNVGAFFALLFIGAFRLPGGVAATAGAVQPLVAGGLAVAVLGEAFTRRFAVAGALGIVGVAMLVLGPTAALDPIGLAAAFAGTLSMATGVVLTKRWGRPVGLIAFTGWQLSVGGLLLAPIALLAEGLPSQLSGANVAGFAWLAVAGTGFAYVNWFRGIGRLPVAAVSILALLTAPVAALLGWLVLGQSLAGVQLVGGALVLTAVALPHLSVTGAPDPSRPGPPRPGELDPRLLCRPGRAVR